jgi:hypothetical protein
MFALLAYLFNYLDAPSHFPSLQVVPLVDGGALLDVDVDDGGAGGGGGGDGFNQFFRAL